MLEISVLISFSFNWHFLENSLVRKGEPEARLENVREAASKINLRQNAVIRDEKAGEAVHVHL